MRYIIMAALIALFATTARATDNGQWANSPNRDWYRNAQLTPTAQKRFPFKSCCEHSDVVRTKFAVNQTDAGDEWFWLDPATNKWRRVPTDIIHYEDRAPDGMPTLFVYQGQETCFYLPDGGI